MEMREGRKPRRKEGMQEGKEDRKEGMEEKKGGKKGRNGILVCVSV